MDEQAQMLASRTPGQGKQGLIWLITAAVVTVLLWQFSWGNYVLYPFTILATWFHEMGHGLMASLLGGKFNQLLIFANGSGLAEQSVPHSFGPLRHALVAAAGPMGPPIAGAGLILASRRFRSAQVSLVVLGTVLLLSTLLWVRSIFGLVMIPALGVITLGIGVYGSAWVRGFAVQFLGVQACISAYQQINYLFSYGAVIGGREMLSDTAQIANSLLLPYWFWGALITLLSLALLVQSLWMAYRD
ncbi:MAG: M50 family metallopeptidase [Synechococcaceae cyanobacterium SM2_3_1]|nr:M50 family metallopeptidase [Synechococcaceae cyanobacterium SM2_3_1]